MISHIKIFLTAVCVCLSSVIVFGQGGILLHSGRNCPGSEVTFSLSSSIQNCVSITWGVEFGGVLVSQSGRTAVVRWNSNATGGEVFANIVNCNGVSGSVTTGIIRLQTITTPTASISSGNTLVCPHENITFSSSVANVGNPEYAWLKNNAIIGNTASITPSGWADGDVIRLIVTSSLTCSSPEIATSNSITVNTRAPATLATAVSLTVPDGICAGDAVVLKANPTNGGASPVYTWTVNGQVMDAHSNTYTINAPTSETTALVTMISSENCVTDRTVSANVPGFTINPLPPDPSANLSPRYRCATAEFYGPRPPAGFNYYWQPSLATRNIEYNTKNSYVVTQPGTYYLRTRSEAGCWSSGTSSVIVNALGELPGIPTASQTYYYIETLPLPTILAAPGTNATICRWYDKPVDGSRVANDGNQIVPPMGGLFERTFYVASLDPANDCESAERLPIRVKLKVDLFVNYIREKNTLIPKRMSENDLVGLSIDRLSESTQYFDGLGTPFQKVSKQGSPGKIDIVWPQAYDAWDREEKTYLPYAGGSDGQYKFDALKDPQSTAPDKEGRYQSGRQYTFYQTGTLLPKDEKPYAKTVFEPSSLNRVLRQGGPGTVWQPGEASTYANPEQSDRSVKKAYEFNAETEVLLFIYSVNSGKISLGSDRYYAVNELQASKTKDEHQHEVIEYIDKEGRTILKKVEMGAENGEKAFAETYYIYDDFGNLVMVLPPEAMKRVKSILTPEP